MSNNGFVKVVCHTNLDDYHLDIWPNYLYNPKIGDLVQSHKGNILKIVSITHCYDNGESHNTFENEYEMKTALKIELHKII